MIFKDTNPVYNFDMQIMNINADFWLLYLFLKMSFSFLHLRVIQKSNTVKYFSNRLDLYKLILIDCKG